MYVVCAVAQRTCMRVFIPVSWLGSLNHDEQMSRQLLQTRVLVDIPGVSISDIVIADCTVCVYVCMCAMLVCVHVAIPQLQIEWRWK